MDRKERILRPAIRMIHIRLPEDVHKKIRVRAAEADVTIQDWVLEAIQKHLKPSGGQKVNKAEK